MHDSGDRAHECAKTLVEYNTAGFVEFMLPILENLSLLAGFFATPFDLVSLFVAERLQSLRVRLMLL